jgi:hypothetical protein
MQLNPPLAATGRRLVNHRPLNRASKQTVFDTLHARVRWKFRGFAPIM